MIGRIASILPLLTAFLITVSVVFELGYFGAIDLSLFSSLSISDHITSFIQHIPTFVFSLFSLGMYIPIFRKISTDKLHKLDMTKSVILMQSEKEIWFLQRPGKRQFYITLVIVLLNSIVLILSNPADPYLFLLTILSVYSFLAYFIAIAYSDFPKEVVFAILIGTPVLLSSYGLGYSRGTTILRTALPSHIVTTDDMQFSKAAVIKVSEQYVIFRNIENNEINVIPVSNIKAIRETIVSSNSSYLCKWTGWEQVCPKQP